MPKPPNPQRSWIARIAPAFQGMGASILVTSLALTGAILGIRQLGLLQSAELAAYDQFIQSQPDVGQDDRLLVVGVTETDLQKLQEWPLSDRTVAQLLQKLNALQPRVIGLDILRDIPIEPGRAELLQQFQTNPQTIVVCKANSADDPGTPPPPGIVPEQIGFADLIVDPGGTLRRSLLMMSPPAASTAPPVAHYCNTPGNTLVSFSLNLALHYLYEQGIEPRMTPTQELWIGETRFPALQADTGGYRGADVGGYQILLHYRSADNAVEQVSLMDVLADRVPAELVRDRIVLVGYTTPQGKDEFYTPYSGGKNDSQKMAGVLVHAQAASQILGAVLDGRSLIWSWSFPVEAVWILGWSLAGGVLAWFLQHPLQFGVMVVGGAGLAYGVCLLLFIQGGWIPLVPAIAAFVSTAVGVVLLDRFNHSTYGQTMYKNVKTFLKLEIEIDEEKLEKQVSEITETDYFRDLQSTAKSLREQQHQPTPVSNLTTSSTPLSNWLDRVGDEEKQKLVIAEETDEELDYIKQIKQESQRLKHSNSSE